VNFWRAVSAGNLPAVSFLKAPAYEHGHAGTSDPIDEQTFLVNTLNRLQNSSQWPSTAVIIAYDDSDGWYDHKFPPIVNNSADPTYDAVFGAGLCGSQNSNGISDRCGHGPRLPILVVSPFARMNAVDRTNLDQTSILRFIEDNWSLGRIGNASLDAKAGNMKGMFAFDRPTAAPKLLLNPATGEPR
jgi:phospholipase C